MNKNLMLSRYIFLRMLLYSILIETLYIVVDACKYVKGIMYARIIHIKISEYNILKLLHILF